jgi:hypothetical protein
VENCDAEAVSKFFEAAIEADLRHREDIEDDFWRRVGESEDEGMTGWFSSLTESENINRLIYQ